LVRGAGDGIEPAVSWESHSCFAYRQQFHVQMSSQFHPD
jgi:hypothetical protein